MAMKPRTSTSLRPVYDDFEPTTELTDNHEAHFLLIHLPGFTKDQLSITFHNYNRMLNVCGERPIDSEHYRRLRFNQFYPIPTYCVEGKLQAKFSQGVLAITMPKKFVPPQSPKTEAQQKGPFPSKKEEPSPLLKAPTDRAEEPKNDKAPEKIPQKYPPSISKESKPEKAHKIEEAKEDEIPEKFRIPRGREDLTQDREVERGLQAAVPKEPIRECKPQKGPEETEPTPTIVRGQGGPVGIEQKPEKGPKEIEKERKTKKEGGGKLPYELEEPEKMFEEKEIKRGKKTPKAAKEDIVGTIGKGIKEVSASTSQAVTKISEGKWKEEEKPMLVNMGAAMLVIAALGVYVSYKIASSGST